MVKQLALKVILLLLSCYAFAEGTKELRPSSTDQGSLLLMPSYSSFGIYGASSRHQIKIRITSTSETIYFGFNNKNGIDPFGVNNDNGVFVPNIPFRIVSPSGTVVYSSVIPSTGQPGNIATWNQAVAGPSQLGNITGYNALQLSPAETGDYILEFNPASQGITRLNLHLFDVTVADVNNVPILGRLHSQGWQISTGSYTNPFNGKVYPYDGSSAVYEVDFNGMQPWVFVINFNSTGTANTGNFIEDRKSKIGNFTYGEYEVFLNPPDPVLYPTQPKSLDLAGNVIKKDCNQSDFCLDFTSNSEGRLEGFIDLNSNGVYDASAGEVYFQDQFTAPGTKCVSWNGRDAFGNIVTGTFQVIASIGFGITHLPLYDVEHNQNGYKVNIVRPAGSTPPLIFWDDTYITDGSALDGKVNLTGCSSSSSGCHRWINRGSIADGNALYKQETINTWWYSTMITTTLLANIPQTHHVQLSFHPTDLVKGDTTVCRGDSLNFYVYNDGKHFDLSKYTYEWFFNSDSIPQDVREQKRQIMSPSEVIVKATDRMGGGCISYDTLNILVVDPVTITGTVIPPTCSTATGSIDVQMLSGPPNKQFFWHEFPSHKSGTLNNLSAGTYNLSAVDPAYPRCGADTSFTFSLIDAIAIDTILTSQIYCYESAGRAEVIMQDQTRIYEYSWNGAAFVSDNIYNSLSPGSHSVLVREISTGCTAQRDFEIFQAQLSYNVFSQNEICNNDEGQITLSLPSVVTDFTITWNGVTDNQVSKTNLSEGAYNIEVQSASYPFCSFDTSVIIENINREITIQSLVIVNSDCQTPQGAATINMAPGPAYLYSWNSGPFVTNNHVSNLPIGLHTVRIQESGTTCIADTSFEIQALNFPVEISSSDEICNSANGSISISVSDPINTEIVWLDGSPPVFQRNSLASGFYSFTIRDKNNPSCKTDHTVFIGENDYSLSADFNYSVANPDSLGKAVIAFTNLSLNYQWSIWDLGDGTTSNQDNPVHAYSLHQDYIITLQVVDSNGCYGITSKKLSPANLTQTSPCGVIALPNVFSPNNDGMNDDIGILGEDVPLLELKIFNRWGEVIFRTFDKSYRWDGKYRGEDAPVGVYPYILDWGCPDDNGNLIRFHKVGDITLVR